MPQVPKGEKGTVLLEMHAGLQDLGRTGETCGYVDSPMVATGVLSSPPQEALGQGAACSGPCGLSVTDACCPRADLGHHP